jgi:hypothetical protein
MQTIVYKTALIVDAGAALARPFTKKACASRWGEILEFHTLQNRINLNQVSRVNFSQK